MLDFYHIMKKYYATDAYGMLSGINLDKSNEYYGYFTARWQEYVEGGYFFYPAFAFIVAYYLPDSECYHDEKFLEAAFCALDGAEKYINEDGTMDLISTNFHDPTYCAFVIRDALGPACEVLRKYTSHTPLEDKLDARMTDIMRRMAVAMETLGFHTPNHRWIITCALSYVNNLIGDEKAVQTMNKFLWEGIDCDEYGEYTERSAGMYNVVCDRSFIQLAHTMNDKKFLEYPIRNMRLMRSFFEPDGTICTLNSVRQDRGTKVYWDTYNVVFMVLAYETGDPEFAYYANKWLNERMCDAQRSEKPYGYTDPYLMYWFLINEDWQNKADKIEAKLPDRDIDVYLPESGMARIYKKGSALTVCRTNNPDFLKFQIGSKYLLARFAGSFFGNPHSQFRPKIMEKTETGFRLVSNEEAGYRSQFDEAPETSVWRHMDHSKRHIINVQNFDTVIDVTPKDDGFALDISFDGASRIPVKLELLIAPDCKVMTDSVNFMARSGDYVYFKNGKMTVRYQDGVAFELTGGSYKLFGSENMRGADPRPHDNFTVCINSQTPGKMHLELKRI